MRTFRNPLWLLAVTGLVIVGGVVALAMSLQGQPRANLRIDGVAVHSNADISDKLSVTGQGLHEDLRAMLLPEPSPGSLENSRLDLPIMLYQLVTDGRLAVANTRSQRLLTLDVTTDHRPTVLGEIKLSGASSPAAQARSITALALVGSKVLVGRNSEGLLLIDVADPKAPRQIDHLEIPGNFHDMESAHEVVYVANQEGGLLVVTIEGDRIRSRQVAGSLKAWRVAAHGRRLVVASQKGGLDFYDLDSLGWPHPVGKLALSQDVRDLVFTLDALYVCTAKEQLLEFALDRWPKPSLAGQLDMKGRPLRLAASTQAKRLFCSMVGSGLAVIDTSRQGAPKVVERMAMAKAPTSLQVHDNRLFAVGIDGLRVIPVESSEQTPEAPEVFHPIAHEVGGIRLVKWKGAAYAYSMKSLAKLSAPSVTASPTVVANGEDPPFLALPGRNEVRLHDIHGMPETMTVDRIPVNDPDADFAEEWGLVRDAGWYAGRLYVLTSRRLQIFRRDAGGMVIPEQEYPLTGDAVVMAWLDSGFVVVAVRHQGLQVIDVRNSREPRLVGEYPLPKHHRSIGAFTDMLVDGHRLIVSRARLGVDIYDLSNPSVPRLLQRIDTPGSAEQLSLERGLLTVGNREKWGFVIDMVGSYGVPVGGYPLTMSVMDLLACGDRLWVANSSGGVMSLPAPQRLVAAGTAAGGEMEWAVPAGIPAGHYSLMLYDDEGESAGFPVVIQ